MVNLGEYGETIGPLAQIDYHTLFEEKVSRARDEMKNHDLGVLLCLSDPNFEYVTNAPVFTGVSQGIGGNRYAILPLDGDPIAFDEACHEYHLKEAMPEYLRTEKAVPLPPSGPYNSLPSGAQEELVERFADQIARVLADEGLETETIGVDVNNELLVDALEQNGLEVTTAGGSALRAARAIKTEEEQQLIRKLAATVDGCFATLAKTARAGVTEREVWSECVSYAIEHGLSVDGGYIASGPHTWPKDSTRPVSDRILRPGDVLFADFFNLGCYGYRSCYYRTFSIGPASSAVEETYETVLRWLTDAEEAMEPGATTEEVIESWPREEELWSERPPYIRDRDEAFSTFFTNMGHGIGLSLYEPPFFWKPTASEWPQELEEGMTIAIETHEGLPDSSQGIRVEDMVLITSDGCEVLSRWPKETITELPLYQ